MIDRQYEPEARMMLDFLHQIAPSGTVYIPTAEYLADALGWPVKRTGETIQVLTDSGEIELIEPGVYRLL